MAQATAGEGILASENDDKRDEIVRLLKKAYWMEIETVMSYIANSVNPDGVRAQEIIESLKTDIRRNSATRSSTRTASRSSTASCPARRTSRPSRTSSSRPSTRPTSST